MQKTMEDSTKIFITDTTEYSLKSMMDKIDSHFASVNGRAPIRKSAERLPPDVEKRVKLE